VRRPRFLLERAENPTWSGTRARHRGALPLSTDYGQTEAGVSASPIQDKPTGWTGAVAALFEHLDQGSTKDEFLEWFPSVSREQVHGVLAFAQSSLEQPTAVA